MTEAQTEDNKEAEIDDLLEFAYELDYEKYMEDYEVRQALAIIKDRVNEITQAPNWKEQITEEWNEANAAEQAERQARRAADPDARSTVTYRKSIDLITARMLRQFGSKLTAFHVQAVSRVGLARARRFASAAFILFFKDYMIV